MQKSKLEELSIEYLKSYLSINSYIGCTINCAYCFLAPIKIVPMRPIKVMDEKELVEQTINSRYFKENVTVLSLNNRTDPFITTEVAESTYKILKELNDRGLENIVTVTTKGLITEEMARKLSKLENIKLVIIVTFNGINQKIQPISSEVQKNTMINISKYKSIKLLQQCRPIIKGINDNFEILNNDVLKVDLEKIIMENKASGNFKNAKIVANLPYYITTPIIMKLLEEKLDLESITVMIQKEVADRLIAIPGKKNTGAITYSVYYYASSEAILEVPKDSFIPAPEVTSKVIKLNIRKEPIITVKSSEKMFKIIKSAFTQRRKTLLNSLVNTKIIENKSKGIAVLQKLGLNENVRPEELTLEQFAKISDNL